MNSAKTTVVPVEMEQARQELERWRGTRLIAPRSQNLSGARQ